MRYRLSAALFALPLLACANSVDVEDIRDHRRQWEAHSIDSYVIVQRKSCFCGASDLVGVRMVIRDGVVEKMEGVSSGLPFAESADAHTLDSIFDQAISSAKDDPDEFTISYDPTHQFISEFSTDPSSNVADDELGFRVSCFSTDLEGGCPVTTLSAAECAEAKGEPRVIVRENVWSTCPLSDFRSPMGRIEEDTVCCVRD
jgi:hypothetical protein